VSLIIWASLILVIYGIYYQRTIGNQPQIEENLPHQSWGHNQSSSVPSSGGAGLGNTQYMSSAFQHDNYYPPSDLPLESQGHHGLSVYGRDPSLAGHSVANPPPAPVITQVRSIC
jgi:hypothetical protein